MGMVCKMKINETAEEIKSIIKNAANGTVPKISCFVDTDFK